MGRNSGKARVLLTKAEEDLIAAAHLAHVPEASLWTVGFHVQQAVEKSLKAVLLQHEIRYPFSHDLAHLLKLVRLANIQLPPNATELPFLTPFGTLYRYDDCDWGLPAEPDVDSLLSWARITVNWAQTLLTQDL